MSDLTAEQVEKMSRSEIEALRVRVGSEYIQDLLRPLHERQAEARAALRAKHGPFYRESVYADPIVSDRGKRFHV